MHPGLVVQHSPLYWKPSVCGSQVDSSGIKVSRHSTTKWAIRNSGISRVSSVMDTRVVTGTSEALVSIGTHTGKALAPVLGRG